MLSSDFWDRWQAGVERDHKNRSRVCLLAGGVLSPGCSTGPSVVLSFPVAAGLVFSGSVQILTILIARKRGYCL